MNRARAANFAGVISIIVNTILFALKMWAGLMIGSIALIADAWHTLSDSLSSVVVVIAVKLSGRKPDKDHPFGHGRWEQIAALFIAFMLGLIAFEFLKDAILRFEEGTTTHFGTIAIVVTVISIVAKEALAQYAFYVYKMTNNVSIKADGWHHRTDALSSVVVLVGILFASKFWWIDSVLGFIISLMLFYATYEIAKEAISKLLGEEVNPELLKEIKTAVEEKFDSNLNLHHFHIHNYVSHQELTFHMKLDEKLSIGEGHRIATEAENLIYKQFNIIATAHIEPVGYKHASD
jgi:cation diffusion facilitator family transporter